MERRLAAVISADIVGYSRLMGEDEDATLAAANDHRNEVVGPRALQYGGRTVKLMGDGILMEFPSAVQAVAFALDVQNAMDTRNRDIQEDRRIVYRIGINVGDIIIEDGDIFGDGVNIAARLEAIAEPGGICISGTVYDQVARKLGEMFEFMGHQTLKNIASPVRAYRSLPEKTGAVRPAEPGASAAFDFKAPDRPSIAILPFKSLSPVPDQDYIADGIHFGLSATMVQLSGLFLIHAPTLNGYRSTEVAPDDVARQLEVRYVLDGAVQRAGNRVRVTVQLTDTEARQTILAERYDREVGDIFKLQDDIIHEVIVALKIKLVSGEAERVWFSKINVPDAMEAYYRASSHFYKFNKDDNQTARALFEDMHRLQPDAVIGPSYIAASHWIDWFFGWSEAPEQSFAEADKWSRRAMEYPENNGIGHAIHGHLQLVQGNFDAAVVACRTGTQLRTSCPLAHGLLGLVQNYCGNPEEAVKSVKEALRLERIYPPWLIDVLAAAYRDRGDFQLSVPAARESIRINPANNDARLILCSDYALSGDSDQAHLVAKDIIAKDPDFKLGAYAQRLPYKSPDMRNRVIAALSKAGLPE
ncbi:hypothetical protein HKCCSP123_09100 [Rhodobacterales bacterium HKCCSP123]|nr:hypothetical protein [Rhodobacterales bacterium HKCCSP123]